MNTRKIKVLFIVGKGRSGSTLLDNTLNAIEGFFSLGEVWGLREAPLTAQRCGCGQLVRDCPFWHRALARAGEEVGLDGSVEEIAARVHEWERKVIGWTGIHCFVKDNLFSYRRPNAYSELARFSEALLRTVASQSGASVLVDSSKWPLNPGPLGRLRGVSPFVLHLVRDPRAVVYSWMRAKQPFPGAKPMPQYSAVYSALSWTSRSLLSEFSLRQAPGSTLRYEDFTQDPAAFLHRVLELLDEPDRELPLVEERTVSLGINHTAMGNANRFLRGEIAIRYDDDWHTQLSARDNRLVTLLTLAFLRRYKYPIDRKLRREFPL